jgi:VWFA-related protein
MRTLLHLAVIAALLAPLAASQQPPTFRSGSTLVPLDVRVLDRDGKPVTDLTERDFTIRENGAPQAIAHFSRVTLAPVALDQDIEGDGLPLRRGHDARLAPAERRVILIVLGRGILELPFRAVAAAIDFVRDRLLPQDYVAVMAYNRATEFTTDRERVIAVLERFRDSHQGLERRLQMSLGGLVGLMGNRRIPASMQADIDRIFGDGSLGTREVRSDPALMDDQVRSDIFRDFEEHLKDIIRNGAIGGPAFDKFLAWIAPTMHDSGNVHAGIEYLRFIDGEKRLIFITEEGFALPRTESDLQIAQAASEARVTIDTIHTGGTPAQKVGESGLDIEPFRRASALSTLRMLAEHSGGQPFSTVRPAAAFEQIDQSTRFQYLLAYAQPAPADTSQFRKVRVTVSRPGVTVHVRRGYDAAATPLTLDRTRIMTDMRILTAASIAHDISDIRIGVKASLGRGPGGGRTAEVSGRIDATRLGWMQSPDGRHRVTLELMIGCVDSRRLLVGEHRQPLVLTVTTEAYEKALAAGINYAVSVPLTGTPRDIKVIVYDPALDLVGSATHAIGHSMR